MPQSQSAEPSMEEILASIRRIIAEDDVPARKPADPPLELTQPAEAAPAAEADDDLMVFDSPMAELEPEPAPQPEPVRAPQPAAPSFAMDEEGLLSEPAAAAALGAFTRLAGSVRLSEAPGQTLEGVVRELLRPMLKEWLDAHLPEIVEAKVEAELQRISRASAR